MQQLIPNYTSMKVWQFIGSDRCCQQLIGTFRVEEMYLVVRAAAFYGLRVQHKCLNGVFFVSVFKRNCLHDMESAASIRLPQGFVLHLKKLLDNSQFYGHDASINISQKNIPAIMPMNFPFKNGCPRAYASMQGIEYMSMVKPETQRIILEMVREFRVTVLNSQFDDLATIVPNLLLAEAKMKQCVFRMLVVQVHDVLASYNSARVASYWGENLGKTVGCQYDQHHSINEDSSIIYTTYDYLLRTLMGKNKLHNFQHITYIVLAEAHLNKANTHILMRELKEVLQYNFNLKIIILCNSDSIPYTIYFNEGHMLSIKHNTAVPMQADIMHAAEVREVVHSERIKPDNENFLMSVVALEQTNETLTNNVGMDSCLDAYAATSEEAGLDALGFFVNLENEDVNYQHSITGVTAIFLAATRGAADHVRLLLNHGADPFLRDKLGRNAFIAARASGDTRCMNMLTEHIRKTISSKDKDEGYVDIEMITNLIQIVINHWAQGKIVKFSVFIQNALENEYISITLILNFD